MIMINWVDQTSSTLEDEVIEKSDTLRSSDSSSTVSLRLAYPFLWYGAAVQSLRAHFI